MASNITYLRFPKLAEFRKLGAQAFHAPWVEDAVLDILFTFPDQSLAAEALAAFNDGWCLEDRRALAAR